MSTNLITTMAQTPSRFGMPIYGSALGATTVCTTGAFTSRERLVAATVKGAFPGTSAWSPPTC